MFESMRNGIISLKMFGCLDTIAERCEVKDKDWAPAAGIHATRISEIRRLYKEFCRTGDAKKIGRAFTAQKYRDLLKGLQSLAGEDRVRREMLELIKKADDIDLKIILTLTTLPPDKKEQLWMYFQALGGMK